jgi:hypothetical protein
MSLAVMVIHDFGKKAGNTFHRGRGIDLRDNIRASLGSAIVLND